MEYINILILGTIDDEVKCADCVFKNTAKLNMMKVSPFKMSHDMNEKCVLRIN